MKNVIIDTLISAAENAYATGATAGVTERGMILRDSFHGWPVSVTYSAESKERKGWFDDAKLDYYPLTVARLARLERYASILSNKIGIAA